MFGVAKFGFIFHFIGNCPEGRIVINKPEDGSFSCVRQ